jgi:spore coat protein JB
MNSYNLNQDYYNYINNNYNQPLYNQNVEKNSVYDVYNGYIRGNMFPALYNFYRTDKPYEITPMNEQAELLTYVDMYTFAMTDLNLYLDVHPDDKEALQLFNEYRKQAIEATKNYENKYGPLQLTSNSLNTFPWAWDNEPWPWDKK